MCTVRTRKKGSRTIVAIKGDLTIDHADTVCDALRSRVTGTIVELDLGGMERIDLAGLQVLYALERSIVKRGGNVSIPESEASQRISRMVAFAGLTTPGFLERDDGDRSGSD